MKNLVIIDETKNFIILEKPQGLPVQPTKKTNHSLISELENHFEFTCGLDNPYIGLVHRLDQNTGGLMIFAKTPDATATLNKAFAVKKVKKTYLAAVHGHPSSDQKTLIHFLTVDHQKNYVTAVDEMNKKSKKAELTYKTLSKSSHLDCPISLLKIGLKSGRQHQIRVQLASENHPLILDFKYGSQTAIEFTHKTTPMMLWSSNLEFDLDGKHYAYHSEPHNHLIFDLF